MIETVLAISGKPGLYKLVNRGNRNLIVEALDATHKRMPAFASDRISALNDIAMFTVNDDVPLLKVLLSIKQKYNGALLPDTLKTASKDELFAFLGEVLPEYDGERIHTNDVKKLVSWYNILVENGITDFEEPANEAEQVK